VASTCAGLKEINDVFGSRHGRQGCGRRRQAPADGRARRCGVPPLGRRVWADHRRQSSRPRASRWRAGRETWGRIPDRRKIVRTAAPPAFRCFRIMDRMRASLARQTPAAALFRRKPNRVARSASTSRRWTSRCRDRRVLLRISRSRSKMANCRLHYQPQAKAASTVAESRRSASRLCAVAASGAWLRAAQ